MSAHWDLEAVVAGLRRSREDVDHIRVGGRIREMPSRAAMVEVLHHLRAALFPTHWGRADLTGESIDYFVGQTLHDGISMLVEQVRRALFFTSDHDETDDAARRARAIEITRNLAARLPVIRSLLVSDLRAAFDGDPAATGISEVLVSYPGIQAILSHRIAHVLYWHNLSFLSRLISEIAHAETGIDIHPGARIGPGFFIDHGTGVVIGETAEIGTNVRIYQAVTLGAKRFPIDGDGKIIKGARRHPIIEDDVVIYAGATILGRVTVGRGSTIGGNVWLTESVAPGSIITQANARRERG